MSSSKLVWIDLDNLVLMEDNPNEMTPEEFQQLIEEMAIQGPERTMPIEVCYSYDGRYFVGDGYHRVKAAEKLGWKRLRAVLYTELTPEDMKILSFKRNRTRGTLNPIKEGLLFIREQAAGLTIRKIAEKYGVTEDYVKKRIIVAKNIPKEVWSKIEGRLGIGYWYEIARLKDPQKQYWIARKALLEGLSKREVKQLVDYLSLPTMAEISDAFTAKDLQAPIKNKRKERKGKKLNQMELWLNAKIDVQLNILKEFLEKVSFPEITQSFLNNVKIILKSEIILKHLEYYNIFQQSLLRSTIFYRYKNSMFKTIFSDKEIKINKKVSRSFRPAQYILKILDPQIQSFENVEWKIENEWLKIYVKNFDKLDIIELKRKLLNDKELDLLKEKLAYIKNIVNKRVIKIG